MNNNIIINIKLYVYIFKNIRTFHILLENTFAKS